MTPSEFVVRRAGVHDLAAVLGVLSTKRPGTVTSAAADQRQRETWAEMLARPGLTTYLAVVEGTAVGTATLLTMPNLTYDCAPTAFVEAVVVDHSHRRRGYATAMLERALADAREAGCNKVQLLTHKRHATDGAHDLYRKVGFEPEAEGFRLYLGPQPTRV